MSVSILVFQICVSVKYYKCTLSFQKSNKVTYSYIGRYTYQHMYMVYTRFCLYYFHTFLCT